LCFDALNGLPGPYIKHFLANLGLEGLAYSSDPPIISSLHGIAGLNTLLEGFPTTSAHSLCTFAYSSGPGGEPILFEGRGQGKIVKPRGAHVFGWNPIFEAVENGKT
jgi:inosine triphosphate pyrophosphatase